MCLEEGSSGAWRTDPVGHPVPPPLSVLLPPVAQDSCAAFSGRSEDMAVTRSLSQDCGPSMRGSLPRGGFADSSEAVLGRGANYAAEGLSG